MAKYFEWGTFIVKRTPELTRYPLSLMLPLSLIILVLEGACTEYGVKYTAHTFENAPERCCKVRKKTSLECSW